MKERILEWQAERRFLLDEKHRVERRLAELDEMLAAFTSRPNANDMWSVG